MSESAHLSRVEQADKHIYISGPLAQRVYSGEYMIASELMQRRHV